MTALRPADTAGLPREIAADAVDPVVLRAEGISKVFPGTTALDDVTFDVYRGQVNVLVGENGAGKSTLMKILAGVEQPTHGRILLDGREIRVASPQDATRHGIGIIFQELSLCANLSVSDNIFLAHEMAPRGFLRRGGQREAAKALIERLEQQIDPDELVANLRVGHQQIVEIARALTHDVQVLIMDEPTSALSAAEVDVLFRVIRDLKARGVAIIYISHKLEELLQIGDRVTILRDGKIVAHDLTSGVDVPWIIEKMVGRSPASLFTRRAHPIGDVLLEVEDITLPRLGGGFAVNHLSLEVRAGEILGLYGLMGAGRSELLECIAGARPESKGRVRLAGRPVTSTTVGGRIDDGIVLVPEDRQRDGLVPTMSVADNMLIASLGRYLGRFLLSRGKEREAVTRLIANLRVRVARPDQSITSLSGGNQQKVVVAKALLTEPRVLMLDEPTRGIDVGAKAEIFEIVTRLAEQSYGVIFVSSDLKEVLAMSDRILVLSRGAITAELSREEATEGALVTASAVGHGPVRSAAPGARNNPRDSSSSDASNAPDGGTPQ